MAFSSGRASLWPRGGGLDRLRLSGVAYVDLALRWPQHFAAMFDAP
jgi:hypothetical protein